ncbi:MAG: hypothetical protein H7Z43_14240 [Clostridia bacterium]|nr:hypothetical protein [Deltaproteobacteria bacterium]
MALPRPARNASPKDFYLTYLPELWRAVAGDDADVPDAAVNVRVGKESYATAITDGKFDTNAGEAPEAIATFVSDLDSWRIALLGLLPRLLKHVEPKLATVDIEARMRAFEPAPLRHKPGTIVVHYEDDAGDASKVTVTIGAGSGRKAEIHATDSELWKLIEGSGRLSQLITSRVRVSGDVAYVLELVRLIET